MHNTTENPANIRRIFPRLLTKLYQKFAILKRVRIISFRLAACGGKEYNNGKVELYLYDESSEKYQKILDGNGSTKITAYKNGVVLLFPVGSKPDQEIIKKFNELVIE